MMLENDIVFGKIGVITENEKGVASSGCPNCPGPHLLSQILCPQVGDLT